MPTIMPVPHDNATLDAALQLSHDTYCAITERRIQTLLNDNDNLTKQLANLKEDYRLLEEFVGEQKKNSSSQKLTPPSPDSNHPDSNPRQPGRPTTEPKQTYTTITPQGHTLTITTNDIKRRWLNLKSEALRGFQTPLHKHILLALSSTTPNNPTWEPVWLERP